MLTTRASRSIKQQCNHAFGSGGLLSFLYCTTTIQRSYLRTNRQRTEVAAPPDATVPRQDGRRTQSSSDESMPLRRVSIKTGPYVPKLPGETAMVKMRSLKLQGETKAAAGKHNHQWQGRGSRRGVDNTNREEHDVGVKKSGSKKDEHVPFEKPANVAEGAVDEMEGSTITPSERRAFEKLFKIQKSDPSPEPESGLESGPGPPNDGQKTARGNTIDSGRRTIRKAARITTKGANSTVAVAFPPALQPMAQRALAQRPSFNFSSTLR